MSDHDEGDATVYSYVVSGTYNGKGRWHCFVSTHQQHARAAHTHGSGANPGANGLLFSTYFPICASVYGSVNGCNTELKTTIRN